MQKYVVVILTEQNVLDLWPSILDQGMNRLASISENMDALWTLSKKDIIFLNDLQQEFRRDLQTFIVGVTLSMKEGKLVIGNNLYKRWLNKLQSKGFDYEVDFK